MPLRIDPALRAPLEPPPVRVARQRDPLGVPFEEQVHLGWCWAACILMVLLYFKARGAGLVNAIAGAGHPCRHCEDDEPPQECTQGVSPERLLPLWECFGIEVEELHNLDEQTLRSIVVDDEKPVQIFYGPDHVVLVVGTWRDDDDTAGFLVHDPLDSGGGSHLEHEWGALQGLQRERLQVSIRLDGLRGGP